LCEVQAVSLMRCIFWLQRASQAGQDCWMDFDYVPEQAGRRLLSDDGVRNATLGQIKTMLTYCVRGERFGDGHWAPMIEDGHVRRLLERLAELLAKQG